ncbi:MAG: MarR family transcriptional regulator [Spirochaetia bacterium]|nr:MarR family transcriptional regulator [Spirochaetia bacterium]
MDRNTAEIIECIKFMGKINKPMMPHHFKKRGVMDLTLSQLDVMGYMYEVNTEKPRRVKMSDLARHAGVKMPTMTDMVNKLVNAGLVMREHDEADRRTVWVSVSRNMEKMVCGHIKERDNEISCIMDCLTEKEKKQAAVILKKIKNSMEERMTKWAKSH